MEHNYRTSCHSVRRRSLITKIRSCSRLFQLLKCQKHQLLFLSALIFLLNIFSVIPVAAAASAPTNGLEAKAAQAECPSGLVHYFGMDETASGTYKDYTSEATATCTSCPEPAAGMFGGAQRFDGVNDGLDLNEVTNFQWGPNSSFTIEVWMQTTGSSSDNRVIIGRNATDSNMIWWLGVDTDGYAVFELRDRKREGHKIGASGKKVNDGKWHHVAVVRDGIQRQNRVYVDGFAIADFPYTYTDNFESTVPVNIGYLALNNGYRFSGLLDELMVYNRPLTESEMRSRYNSGAGNYCGPQQVAPSIVSEAITYGVAGQPYIYDVNATGTPAPAYTLVSGPAGMTINAASGELTWTPAAAGKFSVTVQAANSTGQDKQSFEITVKKDIGETAGLVHHWMLHEITGTRYKDYYTPYDATADAASKPTPVAGVISGGQRFDGKINGLDVMQGRNFDWEPNDNFTIELWMRSTASKSENQVLIGRSAKESAVHWWVGVGTDGTAGFQLLDLEWQGIFVGGSGPKLNDGKWHQVVAVRNAAAGSTKVYVDGNKVAEGSFAHKYGFASLAPVNMGYLNEDSRYRYEGDLDEVKLFGRALSDAEIKTRYTQVYNAIVELIRFEGKYAGGVVELDWETIAEIETVSFGIERSANTEDFTPIGEVPATGSRSTENVLYDYTDKAPLKGKSYYRLKINKKNGSSTYSNIVMVEYGGAIASSFQVYPNPIARGGEVSVEVTNLGESEEVTFMVTDMAGKTILQEKVVADEQGLLTLKVPVSGNLQPGIFNLTVVTKNKTISRKLVAL
ncbi:LamG-like jellyroll fold domain-containing protein [Pontibacter ruber]|uniref:LamG-like jellyroll fold domain-containing protein n=1 Tax=Pontibacter ruber TaxID=1343895 RepID=A0ABW5CSJ0_9BACT|nr:LamG-like jellyroll fold domain-containing protein [Pontibacter ruber]